MLAPYSPIGPAVAGLFGVAVEGATRQQFVRHVTDSEEDLAADLDPDRLETIRANITQNPLLFRVRRARSDVRATMPCRGQCVRTPAQGVACVLAAEPISQALLACFQRDAATAGGVRRFAWRRRRA